MRVLIPAAGLGTRLRPHTHHRPKPLVPVAGSTVLGHVLARLRGLPIEDLVFVVGHLGDQLEAYARAHVTVPVHFVTQRELRGQAHALHLAAEWLTGPLLILFVDTIFEADLTGLDATEGDGVIFVSPVEDARRFGVVTLDPSGWITRFVEKSTQPPSNLAIAGLYYIKDGAWLARAVQRLLELDRQTKGEYYLADALQLMVEEGARFGTRTLSMWADCGTREALLAANRHLLGKLAPAELTDAHLEDAIVLPPVHIEPGARILHSVVGPGVFVGQDCVIERSIVGPYVSLAQGVQVYEAYLRDSILDSGTSVRRLALRDTLLGANVTLEGEALCLNLGDSSQWTLAHRSAQGAEHG